MACNVDEGVLPLVLRIIVLLVAATLAACNSLPSGGPSTSDVVGGARSTKPGEISFALVDINADIVTRMEGWSAVSLQGTFGQQRRLATDEIGVGDYVQVVIWEAAAGGLFSTPASGNAPGSRSAIIPEQTVGAGDGAITVPYAGRVRVAGKTPRAVEQEIVQALTGKAIEPQALVTVTKNIANTVTVVGEVTGGGRVPLSVRGDRILDAVASAGGTKAPSYEVFVTLLRKGTSVRIPMQAIISNPAENIYVQAGDVISVAREPQTFTAAGATSTNSVVNFDAIGITLEQAIARAGGLNDMRADPAGVFVVRYEQPSDYDKLGLSRPSSGALAQVPVIYRVNMRDPSSFFSARRFPIRNKDLLYVSNAPAMDIQKTVNILLPFLGVGATAVTVSAATR